MTGAIAGSDMPGNNWLVLHNASYGNLDSGYLVIDGAFKNFLSSNKAESNGTYDIELVGVTERFGFVAPTSANNRVYTSSGIVVKDCGLDNAVYGGEQVDNSVDPCF